MSTTTKNVGRVSIVPKGDWNINNTYIRLDLVTYNGNSYIAKKDVPKNIQLSNNNYWMLIASKGEQGEQGEQGAPFAIMKSYASIAAMNADFSNTDVQNGQFVIIDTGNVQDPDNAKLYYKGSNNYVFVTDMSGAAGIQGPRGTSAYEQAVAGGYEGTEAQFNEDLADFKELSEQAASSATAADNSAKDAEAYAIGKHGGTDVESTDPTYHNNAKYYSGQAALIVDDVEQVMTSTTIGPTAFATFDASVASMPLKGLTVDIKPVQDFNGYSRPWLGGVGKNQLSLSMSYLQEKNTTGTWTNNSYVLNGVTFEVQLNNDNDVIGINVNGTASVDTNFVFIARAPKLKQSFIENGCPNDGSNSKYRITTRVFRSSASFRDYYDQGSGLIIFDGEFETFSSWITIFSGYTASNLIFQPMIHFYASVYDDTFEPYSNVCPITGWTGCKLHHTGVSLIGGDEFIGNAFVKNGDHYEITLGSSSLTNRGSGYVNISGLPAGQYTIECINYTSTAEDLNLNFRYKKADGTYSSGQGIINSTYYGKRTITLPADATLFQIYILPDTSLIGNKFIMDDIVIRRADEVSELYNGNIYDITFPTEVGTVYGGILDLVNKKLTVTKKYALLNDPDKWSKTGVSTFQYSDQFPDRKRYETILQGFLCSCADANFGVGLRPRWIDNTDYFGFVLNFFGNDDNLILDIIKTAAADNKIAILYDLAEPLVYDITTEQVATLLDENNIWASTGDVTVTYGAYLETIKTYADQAADSAVAAEDAQAAAEAVLESIPEDYTELNDKIDNMENAFIKVSSTQPTEPVNKLWINDSDDPEYVVPTYDEFESAVAHEANFNFVHVISTQQPAPYNALSTVFDCGLYGVRGSAGYMPADAPAGFSGGSLLILPAYQERTTQGPPLNQTQKVQMLIDPVNKKIWMRYANASNVWRDWFIADMSMPVTALAAAAPDASGFTSSSFVAGGISEAGGNSSNSHRIRSVYIAKDDKTSIRYAIPDGYRLQIAFYSNNSGTQVGRTNWMTGDGRIGFPEGCNYFRLQFASIGDATDLTPADDYDRIIIEYGYELIDYSPFITTQTRWLALGDSITYGVCSSGASASSEGTSWAAFLAASLGYVFKNMGVRGMGYVTTGSNGVTWANTLDSVDALTDDYNLITIMLGINDYNNSSATLDSIADALNTGITRILAKYPNARLVVFTPFNARNRGTAENLYDYGYGYPTSNPRTLKDIADKIMEVCAQRGIECHNVSNGCLLNPSNMTGLLLDSIHPSQDCHKLLSKAMAKYLIY